MNKKELTVECFNKAAAKHTKRSWLSRYYWNEITRYCNYFSHEDISVLEVGCGTGDLLAGIAGKRKIGIDFSPAMISAAKEKYSSIEFKVMEAEQLQLDEKFDLIILSNLIGYTDDIQKVFTELKKVCKEDTKVIVTYYNYLWEPILKFGELFGMKVKTPWQNWLTLTDINNLLYISGFDVYRNTKRMILPVYIPLLAELFNGLLAKFGLFRWMSLNTYSFARLLPDLKRTDYEKQYSVSVVIPARNESGNIENAITRLPEFGKHLEIIFVEGNSTDDTWKTTQEIQQKYSSSHDIKILRQKGKGKADAVRAGFEVATGDILMILDADLTVPPEDLPKFYDALASRKGDFINGSRLVYPMEKEAMRFLNRLGNQFFSGAFTWLLEQKFRDTLCGTKVLLRSEYIKLMKNRKYFGEFDPFGDFDLLFGAHKLNHKIVEIPIRYKDRTYGSTNISRFKHGLILLRMCIFAMRKIKFI
ncbi:MAG TPA: glycosyltransferase [Bacteroidia bacterium]